MTDAQVVQTPKESAIQPFAWVILAVIYFASVVVPFNLLKVPPIMPVLLEAFHIDLTQAGLLMSIVAMIGLVLALPAGIILQRLGPKLTLLIALGLVAAGSSIGAFSTGYALLLGSRVIEGLGMGLIGVTAPAIIAMWFPPERQGIPMGIWATWMPIGAVISYNLSPLIVSEFGWQSTWWLGAAFAVVMMLISGALVTRPPVVETTVITSRPVPRLVEMLSNRNIWLLAVEFACLNFTTSAMSTYYPTFLNDVRGYSLGQAAFFTSITTIVVLFSSPAAGWFSDRIGSRRLLLSIPFLGVAALLVFPFHVTGWQISALMVVQGLLFGAIPTATFAAAPEVMVKPEWAGLGLAVVLLGQNAGQLLGPIFFSEMVGRLDWAAAGYLLVPIGLIGFISGWMVKIR